MNAVRAFLSIDSTKNRAVRRKGWVEGVYLLIETIEVKDARVKKIRRFVVVIEVNENFIMLYDQNITPDDLLADDWEAVTINGLPSVQ